MAVLAAENYMSRSEEAHPVRVTSWSDSRPLSENLDEVLRRIRRLPAITRTAPDYRPTTDAIVRSLRILSQTMASDTLPPTLVPTIGGGLQLEWHVNDVDLEVYIDADGSASAWCEHKSGREWFDDGVVDQIRLKKELSLLVEV